MFKIKNYYLSKNIKDVEKIILNICSKSKQNYCLDYSSNINKFRKFKEKLQERGIKFIFYDSGLTAKPHLGITQKLSKAYEISKTGNYSTIKKKIISSFKFKKKNQTKVFCMIF